MEPPFVVRVPSDRFFADDHCANCLKPLPEGVEGLFCSSWCAEISAAVRYQRATGRDGRFDRADVRWAVQVQNAFLLGGGYQALGRDLDTGTHLQVKTRDDGKCRLCGKAGTEIDHIDGSSADLDNLQLLCSDCHRAKTAESLVPALPEEQAQLVGMYLTRVVPDVPTLLADDESEWRHRWRGLKKARKQRFLDELKEAGIEVSGIKARSEMIDARDNWVPPAPVMRSETDEDCLMPDWSWKPRKRRL